MISFFDKFRKSEPPTHGDPDVIVDFIFEKGLFFIAIKNIGGDPAYQVKTIFDKKFTGLEGEKAITKLPLFSELLFLPPGKTITTFLDSSAAYFHREEPLIITVTSVFKNREGKNLKNVIRHNLEIYKEIGYLESSSKSKSSQNE